MSDISGGPTRGSCKLSNPILAGQNEDPYYSYCDVAGMHFGTVHNLYTEEIRTFDTRCG